MNPIEKLQAIVKEMEGNKALYVANPQKDFSRNRKVSFYDMMWFMLFIAANSMSKEIRRAFNHKVFSYISEATILKSRSKIKVSAFEQLLRKFNDTLEKPKEYKGFRLVKVRLKDKWLVLATNLPRQEFSARTLKNLYEKRWKIELAFRDIKHALGALHFHSKKDLFNLQEFFAHLIRYNLTSRIICQIHLAKPKNLKYHYEVNFKNATQIIQDYCRHALDYGKVLEQIIHYVHPLRANRLFQRNCRYIYPVGFNYRVA